MEEYLKTLLEQVRCKKAHAYIEDEIRGHIEDQTEANIACGMTKEEAVNEAVRDMGSPVEAGISLDRIHRTQMAWDIIILMAFISVLGIVIHGLIGKEHYGSDKFALYTVIGFVVMLVVYRMDYSFISKFSRAIAGIFLGIILLASMGIGSLEMNGWVCFISSGGIPISIYSFMMLYVPLYGAVLYQYYGSGMAGIMKGIVWMVVPTMLALKLPCLSLAVILFFSMAVVLSFAVWKGWFLISKKYFMLFFWGFAAILPIIILICTFSFHWLTSYQEARLRASLSGVRSNNYILSLRLSYLLDSKLIGDAGREIIGKLPDFNRSFILTYLSSSYGMAAGFVVCGILVLLTVKIFSISLKQKNQLGMMMGCGCGMVFLSNIMMNILQNIGWWPSARTFLPFFSTGGSSIVVSYALVGIILSIYRYKNIFLKHFKRKMKEITQ